MKKVLLALSLIGLVFAESNINAFWGGWGRNNTPADYPSCCLPQTVTSGCRTRCCRGSLVGRPRWSCCRTLRCCKAKNVCCPRYKCCKPKPSCCPAQVPVCEQRGCVTTPNTVCYEDPAGVAYNNGQVSTCGGQGTVCTEDPAFQGNYPTSYGQPTYTQYAEDVV